MSTSNITKEKDPLKVFIVQAHPEENSFNGALTRTAQQHLLAEGHEVKISDLYKMGWNASSDRRNFVTIKDPEYFKQQSEEVFAVANNGFAADIQVEMEKLFWADVLIFQFPMWWYGMPAILKGWVDRVLAMGAVYGNSQWYDKGKLSGKRAMVSMTVGGPKSMYEPTGIGGDIDKLLFPVQRGIFSFVGYDVLPPFIVWQPARIGDEGRRKYLEEYRDRLSSLHTTKPLYFPGLNDYDPETMMLKSSKV